jgi:hypothetical protein
MVVRDQDLHDNRILLIGDGMNPEREVTVEEDA